MEYRTTVTLRHLKDHVEIFDLVADHEGMTIGCMRMTWAGWTRMADSVTRRMGYREWQRQIFFDETLKAMHAVGRDEYVPKFLARYSRMIDPVDVPEEYGGDE